MIEGFLTASTDKKLVVVGSFLDQQYQKQVEALIARHEGSQRVVFTGGIYEKGALNMLRQHCFTYFHGHSAGGTNPSLLEAMIARNLICAHDNQYNREVCDRFALFFDDAADLGACIRLLKPTRINMTNCETVHSLERKPCTLGSRPSRVRGAH